MIDLQPAVDCKAALVGGVGDDDLVWPTPCGGATVGDLVDHLFVGRPAMIGVGSRWRTSSEGAGAGASFELGPARGGRLLRNDGPVAYAPWGRS